MRKHLLPLLLALVLLLSACAGATSSGDCSHADANDDNLCDRCSRSLLVVYDFYAINDLHGKLDDADGQPGVDELTTYLKNARTANPNSIFLSTGDMWQGSYESNMTGGLIMTEWMNDLGFASMTLGNHEYDWGSDAIRENAAIADFPMLAINIYDRETNQRVDYCQASTVVDKGGLQIGIIGAMGDCYSSIATDKSADVYFKTGRELTKLVKAEADRLRSQGVDFIIYSIHDGYDRSQSGAVGSSQLSSYYDTSLSDGYVDLVFEGHTHQGYRLIDDRGVYHLQNRGDNKGGISHARVLINSVTGSYTVRDAQLVSTGKYSDLDDDPIVDTLLDKYAEQIAPAYKVVGFNPRYMDSSQLGQLIADCYYRLGVKEWGDEYDIILGGGLVSVRSPYNLPAGNVTYGMLQTLVPFDNVLTLCSVRGSDLISKFLETTNSKYYICTADYDTIDPTATYYLVTDTYTAYYAPNRMTVIEEYLPDVFARDLLADYFAGDDIPGEVPDEAPEEVPGESPDDPTPEAPETDVPALPCVHADANSDGECDRCRISLLTVFDFFSINDLHGKLDDADSHPGVDELTTYLKNARQENPYTLFLSAGDMWQGSSESNLTGGLIITDWMNSLGFTSMSLGNHEYDWGSDAIRKNAEAANFPLLAINIYDRATNKRVDYCQASTVVDMGGLQIGVIGAMGDCYSSIATDKSADVYFKTGSELTQLVKAESDRLRSQGVDFIIYTLHDGYGSTNTGSITSPGSGQLSSYYDVSLSNGYVDLVFEGHTHQGYRLKDTYGVYHLQNRGDNKGGISHAEVVINSVTGDYTVREVELISTGTYSGLPDDPIVDELLEKYADQVSIANKVLGYNSRYRSSSALSQLVADCYYRFGLEQWGDRYDIVLGGGYLTTRSPNSLSAGQVTYGDLQSIFPFDNVLTLCSIKGSDLLKKFINTSNSSYYICTGNYGTIDRNATYYIVTDSYTAYYGPNKLTVIEEFAPGTYARDLLADYIAAGGLN